jgi:hypothetical protein
MSQETTREVYNNGHCRVVVELFPEETECREVKYIVGEHCTRIEYVRPFASIRIYARDLKEDYSWKQHIFPGNEKLEQITGHLWWEKVVVVSESTQEERLEKEIVDAIRFADRHFEKYKNTIASGDEAIRNSGHMISAIKEVEKISDGGEA